MAVFRRARAHLTGEADPSRADFTAGLTLARQGYSAEQTGAAIEKASPELASRKAGHVADYVERTVRAILDARDAGAGLICDQGRIRPSAEKTLTTKEKRGTHSR